MAPFISVFLFSPSPNPDRVPSWFYWAFPQAVCLFFHRAIIPTRLSFLLPQTLSHTHTHTHTSLVNKSAQYGGHWRDITNNLAGQCVFQDRGKNTSTHRYQPVGCITPRLYHTIAEKLNIKFWEWYRQKGSLWFALKTIKRYCLYYNTFSLFFWKQANFLHTNFGTQFLHHNKCKF